MLALKRYMHVYHLLMSYRYFVNKEKEGEKRKLGDPSLMEKDGEIQRNKAKDGEKSYYVVWH